MEEWLSISRGAKWLSLDPITISGAQTQALATVDTSAVGGYSSDL
jgi:hypothetical protein